MIEEPFETEKMMIYGVNEKHLLKTDFKIP